MANREAEKNNKWTNEFSRNRLSETRETIRDLNRKKMLMEIEIKEKEKKLVSERAALKKAEEQFENLNSDYQETLRQITFWEEESQKLINVLKS